MSMLRTLCAAGLLACASVAAMPPAAAESPASLDDPASAQNRASALDSPLIAEGSPAAPTSATPAPEILAPETPAPEIPAPEIPAEATAPPRMKPVAGVGMPRSGQLGLQDQYSATGRQARWLHDMLLMPVISFVSLLVLGLMLFIVARYRARRNPRPSGASHNGLLEFLWTLAPIVILIALALPSIDLIAKQYKPAPKEALTVKVTGYQWYWGYEYPDQNVSEIISNMLPPEKARELGEPYLLAADNRLVLPAGRPVRLIITAADVIHSFAVPSLWVKMDAVPGRLNEKSFTIEKPGVYYGQCSELCGARHGFMPIAIEAMAPAEFDAWIRSQGGETEENSAEGTAAAVPAVDAARL